MNSASGWKIYAVTAFFCGVMFFPLQSLWSAEPDIVEVMESVLRKYGSNPALPIDTETSNTIRGLGQNGLRVLLETVRQSETVSTTNTNLALRSPWSAVVGFRIMGKGANSAVAPLASIIVERTNSHFAFMSLAAIGDSGVPAIIKGAGNDTNAQISAVMALEAGISWGNISREVLKQAVPFLSNMLASKNIHAQSRATFTVALMGECPEVDLIVLKTNAQSTNNVVHMPAMVALISIMKNEAVPLMDEWAGSKVTEKRLSAVQAAWYCRGSELISKRLSASLKDKLAKIISDGLEDEDARVRAWAAGHAANITGGNEKIIKLLNDPDDSVVEAVLWHVLYTKYRWPGDVEQVSKLRNRKEERVGFLVGKVLTFFKDEQR
jgi:hypothetical protein